MEAIYGLIGLKGLKVHCTKTPSNWRGSIYTEIRADGRLWWCGVNVVCLGLNQGWGEGGVYRVGIGDCCQA